jgi:UDP-glucose 4-epimerase
LRKEESGWRGKEEQSKNEGGLVMRKVLVTGGAGFIGSHVVDGYLRRGWEVVVVDNLSTGKKGNLNQKATFYEMDVTDPDIDRIFLQEKFDLVNHHAAQIDVRISVRDPLLDAQINILGTLNLLTNCQKYNVDSFIFISSGGVVYGEPDSLPAKEEFSKNPLSPYGVSKHTIEHYLYYYQHTFGLKYLAFRYANVYGPRQDPHGEAGVIAIFGGKMLQGKTPFIYGDGEQLRDYIYVGDVVAANLAGTETMQEPSKRKISSPDDLAYNVGTQKASSVNLIYQTLAQITRFEKPALYAPERKGEIRRTYLNIEKAKKELGWKPELDLREGLVKTVDWFRKNS